MNTPTISDDVLGQASAQARNCVQDGLAASQADRSAEACRLFEAAAGLEPAWALPPFLLASEKAALSDFQAAEAGFAQAVLLAPDFHIARYQLGLLQFSGGRPQVAFLSWAPLADLPGELPFPHLVRAFLALHAGRSEEARARFEAALSLATDNAGMVADIRRLIAAIPSPSIDAVDQPATRADAAPAQHVLLGNYRRSTLH